ncbi:DUF4360 domain-containing protein [Actinomadura sp. 3N508]|uniref:DUF4360 domain-containing protein n=1 Tax=Actinomadura sp. 3N508 TaxID=3375153 RepID=UPI0037A1CCF3
MDRHRNPPAALVATRTATWPVLGGHNAYRGLTDRTRSTAVMPGEHRCTKQINPGKENRMHKGIALPAVAAAALALTAASLTPAAASAPTSFPPIEIKILSQSGSGCEGGTVAARMADDFESFSLTFADYTAHAGGSSKPADGLRDCRLRLDMNFRKGYSYAISQTDYRGTFQLQSGARAILKTNHNFQDGPQNELKTHEARGVYDDNFQFTDTASQLVWQQCGTEPALDITTELRVLPGFDKLKVNSASMSSFDGSIKQIYHLKWKPCP